MVMKNKKYLTRQERLVIFRMSRLGISIRGIGRELGRSHSTVSRELKRCNFKLYKNADYFEHTQRAQSLSEERISKGRRRDKLKSPIIRHFVELHLKEAQWTPEETAGKLSKLGYPISTESIYLWINNERGDLKSCLKIAGKSRKRRRAGKKTKRVRPVAALTKKSIEIRPKEATERITIGHFELDAVLSARGSKYALQVLVDRFSRRVFLQKVSSLEASTYTDSLMARVHSDISCIRTITSDNGGEHAQFGSVESALNLEWFFCHPYCASERGTVENRNKKIRSFFPKGTRFDEIPDEFIQWVEDQLNHTPMKILNFDTPHQAWERELQKLAA